MSEITADQARANAESSSYGAKEIAQQISQTIEAISKTGATSATNIFSKESVHDGELQGAIAILESRGFTVKLVGATESHFTTQVSW
ncbi:hypothetical protein GVN72_17695 [Aeromonas caviae]|uniref:hypothetical protein n=1 Tax=Aeromonas TaxID=642 RepID=UPI001378E839|nr:MULTISPECIES: hypothetical protein [Aeromonas]MCK2083322.1 hypothetical protein [Aeromonas genomosp. paramedia]MDX7672848.1 hypothetical protein [Aeromonas caviae]NBA25430.1 hypothetical protein [Aeromonas caviae]